MSQTFEKKQLAIKKLLLLVFLLIPLSIFGLGQNFFYFIVGYVIGFSLMFLDERYFYRFYQDTLKENDAQSIGKREGPALITRNALFLLAMPILSFFVLSSTGSLPGIGLILAMNLILVLEFWQLRSEPLLFQERFLSNLERPLSRQNVNKFCYIAATYFLLLLFIWL